MIRAQGPIAASPLEILQCSYCPEFQRYWDQDLECSEVLYKHRENLLVVHKKTRKTMIFPAMDLVFDVFLNKEIDGSIREVMASANQGCLEVPMSGRYLRVDTHDKEKTWVTIVHEMAFKQNVVPAEVARLHYRHYAY